MASVYDRTDIYDLFDSPKKLSLIHISEPTRP